MKTPCRTAGLFQLEDAKVLIEIIFVARSLRGLDDDLNGAILAAVPRFEPRRIG
jgi:hypothetical protein